MMERKNWEKDPFIEDQSEELEVLDNQLILYNDEVNTFEYVIESLVEVCNHDLEQAEQCTYITHYKGKCDVRKGDFELLKPMKDELMRRGLKATIN